MAISFQNVFPLLSGFIFFRKNLSGFQTLSPYPRPLMFLIFERSPSTHIRIYFTWRLGQVSRYIYFNRDSYTLYWILFSYRCEVYMPPLRALRLQSFSTSNQPFDK